MEYLIENHEIDEYVTSEGIELFDRVGDLTLSYGIDDNKISINNYASFEPYNSDDTFEIKIDVNEYYDEVAEYDLNLKIAEAEHRWEADR